MNLCSWYMFSEINTTHHLDVTGRSKANVYGRCITESVDSNPTKGMDVRLLWSLCEVR
jgi:hypothetical protein